MIEIDIILGSTSSKGRDDLYVRCVAKSVLANRGIVPWIMAWSTDNQLQFDEGGENS